MNATHPPITDAGGVPLHPTPWQQLVRGLVEDVQEAFMERFGKPIAVEIRNSPENGTTYHLRHTRPGLLPTAIEAAWFEAFIKGYRCAGNRAHDLFIAPGEAN
jgi:hypothetical protein